MPKFLNEGMKLKTRISRGETTCWGQVWIFYLTCTVESPTTLRIIGKKYIITLLFLTSDITSVMSAVYVRT